MIKHEIDGWISHSYAKQLPPILAKPTPRKRYRKLPLLYILYNNSFYILVGIDIPDYVTVRSRDRPIRKEDIIKR